MRVQPSPPSSRASSRDSSGTLRSVPLRGACDHSRRGGGRSFHGTFSQQRRAPSLRNYSRVVANFRTRKITRAPATRCIPYNSPFDREFILSRGVSVIICIVLLLKSRYILPLDAKSKDARSSMVDSTWFFDEALPLRRYTIDNQKVSGRVISELRITQANHIDRGDYTCVATNAYGHARAGIKLLVQEPPNFPRNLHVAEQGSRSLLLAWSSPSSEQDPAHASSPITKYIVQYKEAQGRLDDSFCWPRSGRSTIEPGSDKRTRHCHEFSPRLLARYINPDAKVR